VEDSNIVTTEHGKEMMYGLSNRVIFDKLE